MTKRGGVPTKGIASAKQPNWKGWPIVKAEIDRLAPRPGFETKAYREWVHKLNGVLAANASLQQMVRKFYRLNFWDVNRLGELSSQAVANKVYDCGVNQGAGTAAMILQHCLGVDPDGCIGPVTIAAANKRDGAELAEAFRTARVVRYRELVASRPQYAQYLDEWISRC